MTTIICFYEISYNFKLNVRSDAATTGGVETSGSTESLSSSAATETVATGTSEETTQAIETESEGN